MFIKVDFFVCCRQVGVKFFALGLTAAVLTACTVTPPSTDAQSAAPAPVSALPASTAPVPTPSASAVPLPDRDPIVRVLAYFDRIRSQSAAELGQEVARLGNPHVPVNQLQLALALGQLRQPAELGRAQELLTRLLANPDPDAQVLHPLARLLATRLGEQRRLEDLLDKQTQQTRDLQRRLDQTNERLEALKAIERSLTSRPPPPAAAPAHPALPVSPASAAPASASRSRSPRP